MPNTDQESASPPDPSPFREYAASMATQLAKLARKDGDEILARALESAAALARKTQKNMV